MITVRERERAKGGYRLIGRARERGRREGLEGFE